MVDSVPTQAYIHSWKLVMQWDDSAAREAYFNAKNRYWRNCNGLPSNIPLASPDAYVDDINWSGVYSRNRLEQACDEEDYSKKDTNKYKNIDNKESQGYGGNNVDKKRRKYGDGYLYNLFRHSTSRGPSDHDQKDRWWRRNIGRKYVRAYDG